MRQFQTISEMNTVSQWVDAFNNNALASSDHTWYLGEMLFNGVLYTGLETIGGQKVQSLTNLNISSAAPTSLELDNFYLYFRDINKILLVDKVTFDLSQYNTNEPTFFYVNSELGFRVSQEFKENDNEVMLFRFILGTDRVFKQCYFTAQRFGSNVYDTADEFYQVTGCIPKSAGGLTLKLDDGKIKRSGIKIDYHQVPDVLQIIEGDQPYNLRYITVNNTIDYDSDPVQNVITDKMLNYNTKTLSNVPNGQFTAQRILYDVYENCLIMQYGSGSYPTMDDALSSLNNLVYPFPYGHLMYIPLGVMFIKKGATDLSDPTSCIIIQQLNTTVSMGDSTLFAEDSYARGRLLILQQSIEALEDSLQDTNDDLNAHIKNYSNPHKVTKAQIGLGNVDNVSQAQLQSTFDSRYIRINGNQTKNDNLNINGELSTNKVFITVGGRRVYVGADDGQQRVGDYKLP